VISQVFSGHLLWFDAEQAESKFFLQRSETNKMFRFAVKTFFT